jgi:hypothetical protein
VRFHFFSFLLLHSSLKRTAKCVMVILFRIASSIFGANTAARPQVCGQILFEKGAFFLAWSNLQFLGQIRRPDIALGRRIAEIGAWRRHGGAPQQSARGGVRVCGLRESAMPRSQLALLFVK